MKFLLRFSSPALVLAVLGIAVSLASAEVRLPAVIGDHMVLQQGMALPLWGWAEPEEKVSVAIAGQRHEAETDNDGKWKVMLDKLAVSQEPLTLTVSGSNTIEVQDILVGEVWLCSGQSNMEWPVAASKDPDLEIGKAHFPQIRLLTVNTPGTQESIEDFDGAWQTCSPEAIRGFSAVGYFFGREIHQQLGVPIGLIDNAWGGSSCEAWVRRDLLEGKPLYEALLARWAETESTFNYEEAMAKYEKDLDDWNQRAAEAKAAGEPAPSGRPGAPQNVLANQHRPGNLYHGRIKPVMPFGIRGAIWYQGESNASRAYQYRHLFPLMIQNWREDWDQGEFPFYWVQLADFREEVDQPGESDWAELREAQSMTLDRLPNTGEAVIIDLGEASDIHPRNKQDVGKRLARLALANDYGVKVASTSPRLESAKALDNKMVVVLKNAESRLRVVDARDVQGFALAGEDKQWHAAQAQITGENTLEVWAEAVPEPVAVRYAWADNPVCNLYTADGLPVTPFRSDDWPGKTAEAR